MELIKSDGFSFSYTLGGHKILDNVSFSVNEGELILLCGATACGKTTLLKSMKPELAPNGIRSGCLFFDGMDISSVPSKQSASEIGYVMQRPENQTVTDRVRSELAFGCESLGLPQNEIHRRIAEISVFFSLSDILDAELSTLSGGQLQLLNLASAVAMYPKLLLLDEPTAQLDPIASGEFIRTLYRLTRELSITVIIAEHRFSELLSVADRVLFLENGKVGAFDFPKAAVKKMCMSPSLGSSMPWGLQIWNNCVEQTGNISPPLRLSESRNMLRTSFGLEGKSIAETPGIRSDETALRLKNVCFAYSGKGRDIISHADLEVKKGECFAVLGGNGSGKSTLLSVISGIVKPYCGKIEIFGRSLKKSTDNVGILPQDVRCLFLGDTVGEVLDGADFSDIYDFSELTDMHPFDLSGGQAQLLGLAVLLSRNKQIILLDEPTKGLDGFFRSRVTEIIKSLIGNGTTVIIVTHDTELAAECADRCGIFFDGSVMSVMTPRELFAEGIFYTTEAAKMSRGICSGAVTAAQLSELCRRNPIVGGRGNV